LLSLLKNGMALPTQVTLTALLLGFSSIASFGAELPLLAVPAFAFADKADSADVQKTGVGSKESRPLHDERNEKLESRAQRALDECQQHFDNGQALLDANNVEGARKEFDLAVEALMDLPENLPDRAALERRAEEIIRRIHRYDLEALGAGASPEGLLFTQSPLDELLDLTFPVDPSLKNKVLESVRAASSELPLEVNDTVVSYINYFTSPRGRRVFLYGWKRAGRYRAMIERVLREEGLPAELIHLAQAESGFAPRAVSVKACAGMWQFGRGTGSRYGLQADRSQDDRLDPEKATRAAARHLHDLYRMTGNWYLAMAGYDCGPLCVERAVQRTGFADFWELCRRNALPMETQHYVPAILAMAIIAKDPAAYGMDDFEQDPALEFDTIRIEAPTQLPLLADAAGTPVTELRDLNPSLLLNVAPSGEQVRVPRGRAQRVLSAIEMVPEEKRATWRLHRIQDGDNLAGIAHSYGVSTSAVLSANAALGAGWFEKPHVGDFVLVPAAPKVASAPVKGRHGRLAGKKLSDSSTTLAKGHKLTPHGHAPTHSARLTASAKTKSVRTATR
jgi:membrane-bound lytic murein transglycosylase D